MKVFYLLLALLSPAALAAEAPAPRVPVDNFLERMDGAEQDYYLKLFDYVMDNIGAGVSYKWKSYASSGDLIAEAPFAAPSNTSCRKFRENVTVKGVAATYAGVGCRRVGKEGWCRLREGNMLSCALEETVQKQADRALDQAAQSIDNALPAAPGMPSMPGGNGLGPVGGGPGSSGPGLGPPPLPNLPDSKPEDLTKSADGIMFKTVTFIRELFGL